ncbi:tRNA intron endonuclease, catalytic C-terminal domain [Ceratobasidium sp. AG-Ba]|nr:tRNA intron endonuclease, catalytic C-terminal domain [Ceratobasidium sp. AG-Ba]
MPRKVPLHVSNRTAYVWSVDDIATLRTEYRICGTLTGTLPSISQQNVFLGVPLTLLPEEVAALVDTDKAYIIDDSQSYSQPTREQLEEWAEARKASIAEELKQRDAAARATVKIDMSDKAQKKREARKAAKQQQPRPEGDEFIPTRTDSPALTEPQQNQPHTVHVPSESSTLSWYNAQVYHSISEARDAGIWSYPSDEKERAECAVFRDLWEKGNYLGPGIKFGGNYLVYPGSPPSDPFLAYKLTGVMSIGDPLRYHSHFVVTVHPSKTSPIRPMDIVAFGRLGTATKKVHLLGGYDDETGDVSYYSIEWASFG